MVYPRCMPRDRNLEISASILLATSWLSGTLGNAAVGDAGLPPL
ncbi:MAG: hypothetical protein ACKO57_08695 [Alphaproteobacteria bacterium]